jgi:hypothetical protein
MHSASPRRACKVRLAIFLIISIGLSLIVMYALRTFAFFPSTQTNFFKTSATPTPDQHDLPKHMRANSTSASFKPSAYVFMSSPEDVTAIFLIVSAFIDTRALLYGSLLYGATPELVLLGAASFRTWGAFKTSKERLSALISVRSADADAPNSYVVTCNMEQHFREQKETQTIRTTKLVCSLDDHWATLQHYRALHACAFNHSLEECTGLPPVPVNLMPKYPLAPTIDVQTPASDSVAVCLQPLYGNMYDDAVRFFMWYYKQMGVSAVLGYGINPSAEYYAEMARAARDFDMEWEPMPWCPLKASSSPECPQHLRVLNPHGWQWTVNGQTAAQMDCILRTSGRFRWVLFADFDEFITVRTGPHLTFQQLIQQHAQPFLGSNSPPVLPYGVKFQDQHHCKCSNTSHSVSVPYMQDNIIPFHDLGALPYPFAYNIALGRPKAGPSKFITDPLIVDNLWVHRMLSSLCARHSKTVTDAELKARCAYALSMNPKTARITHMRSPKSGKTACPSCSEPGTVDYTFANRVVPLLDGAYFAGDAAEAL